MARLFDGVNDQIRMGIGNNNFAAPITLAAIIKRGSDGTWDSIISFHTGSGSPGTARMSFEITDGNTLNYGTASGVDTSGFGVSTSDGWAFVCVSKASGTTTPRFHAYYYATGLWEHGDGGGTLANGTAPGSSGQVRLGSWQDDDWFDGTMAVAGAFNRTFSDAEIEASGLPFSLLAWIANGATGVWPLYQNSTSQNVVDLRSDAAQASITGTAVADGPPSFGLGGRGGTPTYVTTATILPGGIASTEAFGTALLTHVVAPTGIASTEAFGTTVLSSGVSTGGIASAEAFGSPALTLVIAPSGIGSAEAFGTTTVSGAAPAASTGVIRIFRGWFEFFDDEDREIPPPDGSQTIICTGIPSEEAFGHCTVTGGVEPAPPDGGGGIVYGRGRPWVPPPRRERVLVQLAVRGRARLHFRTTAHVSIETSVTGAIRARCVLAARSSPEHAVVGRAIAATHAAARPGVWRIVPVGVARPAEVHAVRGRASAVVFTRALPDAFDEGLDLLMPDDDLVGLVR